MPSQSEPCIYLFWGGGGGWCVRPVKFVPLVLPMLTPRDTGMILMCFSSSSSRPPQTWTSVRRYPGCVVTASAQTRRAAISVPVTQDTNLHQTGPGAHVSSSLSLSLSGSFYAPYINFHSFMRVSLNKWSLVIFFISLISILARTSYFIQNKKWDKFDWTQNW